MSDESFKQIGKFIFQFQIIESQINGLIVLIADADDEMITILMNELGFFQRIQASDVMFARFVDVRHVIDNTEKTNFHKTMSSLQKLAERRNDLVHSRYYSFLTTDKGVGLLRQNSKLSASSGERKESKEELYADDFVKDFEKLSMALSKLEEFRLKIIDWKNPYIGS
jgi:hypothetical protein